MSYPRFAEKAIFALAVAALATLLFVMNSTLYPFVFPKVWLFRIIIEVMLVLYVPLAYAYPAYRPPKSLIWWGLAGWLGVLFVSSIAGVGFYKSFWSNAERMEGLFGLAHYAVFAVILAGAFRGKSEWIRWLVAAFVGISALAVVSAVFSMSGSESSRLEGGVIGNPAYFASQLLFAILFAVLLWIEAKDHARYHWTYLGLAVAFALAVFATGTRGALAGLLAGVCVATVFMVFTGGFAGLSRKKLVLAIAAILWVVSAGVWWVGQSRGWSLADANVRSRLTAARISIEAWKERPILGWGMENYNIAFNKHMDPALITEFNLRQWFDRAHNRLLDMLVMGGVMGLAAYLAFFGTIAAAIWRLKNTSPSGRNFVAVLFGGFVAYGVQNLFFFDVHQSYVPLFLIAAWIVSQPATSPSNNLYDTLNKKVKDSLLSHATPALPLSTVSLLMIAIMAPVFWFGSVKPYQAAHAAAAALHLDPAVSKNAPKDLTPDERFRYIGGAYQYALEKQSYVTWEALQLFERYYVAGVREGNFVADHNVLSYLIGEFERHIVLQPSAYEAYMALGEVLNIRASLYLEASDDAKARQTYQQASEALDKALALAPNIPRVRYAKGTLQLGIGSYDDAIATFEKALALNPQLMESHWTLGAAYSFIGDYRKAADAYDEAQRLGYVAELAKEFRQLIQAYNATGQDYKIEDAALRNVAPEKGYWTLGIAYVELQVYQQAASAFEKAQELGYQAIDASDLKLLFETYAETAQYAKLELVLKKLIELEPDFARWHAVLAATYKGMGRYDDARRQVELAVEKDPAYAKEAEIFLKALP